MAKHWFALFCFSIFQFNAASSGNPESLLSRFPGKTAKVLSSLVKHFRVGHWSFKAKERRVDASRLRLVVPPTEASTEVLDEDDDALIIKNITANWTSYTSPIIDLEVTNATIKVSIDEIFRRRGFATNWHRLHSSGFPPPFPVSKIIRSPKFRKLKCHGNCRVLFSATAFGRQISEGLPELSLSGEAVTAMWERAVDEWFESRGDDVDVSDVDDGGGHHDNKALGVDEAAQALMQVVLSLVLDELLALAKGDEGTVLSAVRSGIEAYVREVSSYIRLYLRQCT